MNNISDSSKSSILDMLLEAAIDSALMEVYTALPATVRSIDGNLVDIQISLNRADLEGELEDYPVLTNVPLHHCASSEEAYLRFPIKKGTPGMALFSQRALTKWKKSDGENIVDPQNDRKFSISDATFLPGLLPKKRKIPNDKNVELRNKNMSIELSPDGKIKIEGATGDIVSLMSDTVGEILGLGTIVTGTSATGGAVTGVGVVNVASTASLTALKTKIDGLKL